MTAKQALYQRRFASDRREAKLPKRTVRINVACAKYMV